MLGRMLVHKLQPTVLLAALTKLLHTLKTVGFLALRTVSHALKTTLYR